MVSIYVGVERKKFRLHLDLICDRSDFFRASFQGNFKEAETKELSLPEDSVESFELLAGWLYGATLMSIPSEDELSAYFDLFILAEKLCLEHLQNETMDHILRFYRLQSPKVAAQKLRSIYDSTSAKNPLNLFIIKYVAWTAVSTEVIPVVLDPNDIDLLKGGGNIAANFTLSLANYYAMSNGDRFKLATLDPRGLSNCFYHKHNSKPVCDKSSK